MLNLWWVNLDYLVLRSVVTSDPPISFLDISQLAQHQLRLHGIPAVLRARKARGQQLKSAFVDVHVVPDFGRTYLDFVHHVDDLYLHPVEQAERVVLIHSLLAEIPGLYVSPLQANEVHLAYTFSCGRIARQSIRRVRSRKSLWPELVPYRCGELALYSKSQELQNEPNRLRSKGYIVQVCRDLGYDQDVHGELKRAEFRLKGAERLRELGWPNLEAMGRQLVMDEYPLMLKGGKRGAAVDPAWAKLAYGAFPRPNHLPKDVWNYVPDRQAEINKALGTLEYAAGVLLAETPNRYTTGGDVLHHLAAAYYPRGSSNERDLLDRVGIEREEASVESSAQLKLPFLEEEEGRSLPA